MSKLVIRGDCRGVGGYLSVIDILGAGVKSLYDQLIRFVLFHMSEFLNEKYAY